MKKVILVMMISLSPFLTAFGYPQTQRDIVKAIQVEGRATNKQITEVKAQ
jgi:hypothetical protein